MAVIDPKKLLPDSSKTTSILVPKKNVSISTPGAPALKPASAPESVGGSLVVKKLIKIDEVLQDNISFKKKTAKKEEQEKQKEKREKKEKVLESKKDKKKKADKLFNVPKDTGIDFLSNWLQWTVIGFLFNNLKGLIAYLAPIWNNVIKPLGKILYNVFTTIVSGVTNFIEFGYNAYSTVEGLVEKLGGEDAKEEFNKASSALTTALNVAIIGLMIAASTRPGGGRPGRGGTRTKPGRGGSSVRPGTGGRPKVTTSGGGRAGGLGLRNPLRQTPKVTSGSGASRVTGAIGNRLTGRGAAKVTTGAAGRLGLRSAGRLLKPILGRLPIVGGLIEFLISWAMGDPIGKAAFRGVGATLFAALGGIIGSVVPVFGTAIGAALGGFAGGEAGGLLYDVMFGNKNVEGKVEKKQGGGQVGARKKPSRQIGRAKKKVKVGKVDKVSTLPGKDFATKKKIEEFYGKDKGLLGSGLGAKKDTPYDGLTEASEIAKRNRSLNGVIGALIGTGIDLTLGQKPSNNQIKQISDTLTSFVQASMQAEMNGTVANIQQTFALKEGGSVPSSRAIGRTERSPVVMMRQKIESGIKNSIEKTSNEVFSRLRLIMDGKAIADKKRRESANNNDVYSSADGGGMQIQSSGTAEQNLAAFLSTLEAGGSQNQADAFQVMLNRTADAQSGGSFKAYGTTLAGQVMGREQFSPYSAAIYGTSADNAAAAKYGPLSAKLGSSVAARKRKLIEIAGKGLPALQSFFNAGSASQAAVVLEDFKSNGPMSQKSAQDIGSKVSFRGYRSNASDFNRGAGGNFFFGPGTKTGSLAVVSPGDAPGSFADVSGSDPVFPFPGAFHKSSDYGMRNGKMHAGIDIVESQVGGRYRADARTPILAAADGTVVSMQYNSGRDAYLAGCRIDHPSLKMSLRYLHMNPKVSPGDKVKRGQVIGTLVPIAGNGTPTGNTHLHLEFYKIGSSTVLNNSGQIYRQFLSGSTKVTMGQIKSGNLPQPVAAPQSPQSTGPTKFSRSSINSFFAAKEGFRKFQHEGIDIEAPQGTKISFSVGGTIIAVYPSSSTSKDSNGGYGAFVDLKLDNGKIIRMSHLSKIFPWVKSGAKFGPNEAVALSGGKPGSPGAGRSGGPHIHFEQHEMSGLGIEETMENKVDPLKAGAFDYIQKGGTLRQNISSLQTTPAYAAEAQPVLLYQKELVMVG